LRKSAGGGGRGFLRGAMLSLLSAGLSASAPYPSSAAPACFNPAAGTFHAEAADARSVRLADGRVLRLAGIEPFTLLLDEAGDAEEKLKRRLAALVAGAELRVEIVDGEPDRYGRFPALAAIGDSLLQEKLAGEGLALAFAAGDPLPCFERLLAAEAEARQQRRGLWSSATVADARPEALVSRIGRFAIFEGIILSVGTRPATTYLDFGRRWSEDVTIEIPAKDRDAFGGEAALERLEGARIRARGFPVDKAGPMLPVRSPMQLEILDSGPDAGRIDP
jgi:endonuclease YncB( thermonuclease family)